MVFHLLILYVAFSLLFILMMGLFFSRIGKKFPVPPMLSEKIASQKTSPPVPEVSKPGSRVSSEKTKVASRTPAFSFSHGPAKGI
jgi:hypothetical protein